MSPGGLGWGLGGWGGGSTMAMMQARSAPPFTAEGNRGRPQAVRERLGIRLGRRLGRLAAGHERR